ncbi:MAG: glycosyltransferase family 9 protein [Bacteroidales bacterium]|nr:glycosyltransferase family 9 protein [Bacteroidales bacterium]
MQRFLIIRFSSIGDIVLTTPVIRCMANQYPEAEIHYLTKEQNKPLLAANPHLKRIWTITHSLSEVIPELLKQKFTFVVDLHRNIRSLTVKTRLGKPSGTFCKLNLQKWLLVRFKLNYLPDLHIVDRYFDSLKKLHVVNDGQGLDFFIESGACDEKRLLPDKFRQNYVVWAIGGKHFTKIFPPEKIISVCSQTRHAVILLGGSEDRERGNLIESSCRNNVFNACGKLTIQGSAAVIKDARRVITNDTGLMHIAAAYKKNILSLWGNTVTDFGMYPYLPGENSVIMEVEGLSCRPCSKLGFDQCPKGHFRCMKEMDEAGILSFLNDRD